MILCKVQSSSIGFRVRLPSCLIRSFAVPSIPLCPTTHLNDSIIMVLFSNAPRMILKAPSDIPDIHHRISQDLTGDLISGQRERDHSLLGAFDLGCVEQLQHDVVGR